MRNEMRNKPKLNPLVTTNSRAWPGCADLSCQPPFVPVMFGAVYDDVLTGKGKKGRRYGNWQVNKGFWKEAA